MQSHDSNPCSKLKVVMEKTTNKGQWLDDLLNELGWTSARLSLESGLDSAVISNIRNGKRNTGIDVAKKIADATGRPENEIFERAGLMKESTQDRWVRRVEHKLEQITDEDDRRTIEGLIDILSPDKKTHSGRRAKSEST